MSGLDLILVCGTYSEICPLSLNFPILWSTGFWRTWWFSKFCQCLLIFPLSILILLIWIVSLFLLVSLDQCLSILLIFLKNQLFVSLILCIIFLISILLISALNLIIFYHLLLLGKFASFCSQAFRYSINCLVWDFSSFFI